MTLTRSEAGAQRLRIQKVDLAERARNAVQRLGRQAEAKGVDLMVPDPVEAWAEMDPELMDRVIGNLLDNAIKFTPEGGWVEARVQTTEDRVVLEVMDSGPGIPPEKLEWIFRRFFRVDEARTTTAETSGTGLGLAIVRAIVHLHGGTVAATNRTEGGAVFRVILPTVHTGTEDHEESFMSV